MRNSIILIVFCGCDRLVGSYDTNGPTTAQVSGTIALQGATTVSGASVVATQQDVAVPSIGQVSASADGAYTLSLASGTYTLALSAPGYVTQTLQSSPSMRGAPPRCSA